MAVPKIVSAKCPTCGANLPVPPGVPQVTCRYCQNVIHVEHRKAPPEVAAFGSPGAMPSRTLYVDPDAAAKAGRSIGCAIAGITLFTVAIPIAIGVLPWAFRSCKSAVKPFPVACATNEELELSGTWEGTGPIITSVGHNCKLHLKNAKLKGTTLVKTDTFNLELTLEGSTIETTETMVHTGSNLKVKIHGSTLTAGGAVFDSDSNMEILELDGSTLESKTGFAFKAQHNLKINAENSKIRGKKGAINCDANLKVSLKKGSEITSSDGPAIKTTSSFKLDAEGGKIDGPGGAVIASSGMDVDATGLTFSSSKASAIATSSGLKLDLTDGTITSQAESAVHCEGGELNLVNTKLTGVEAAITGGNGLKVKASKKSRLVASTGAGLLLTTNGDVVLNDAAIEGGAKGVKATSNMKVKLAQGSRIAGKTGGIEIDSNFEIDGTGATIDGGAGPGLMGASNAKVTFRQGALKGVPALVFTRRPSTLELDGTRIDGEQRIPAR